MRAAVSVVSGVARSVSQTSQDTRKGNTPKSRPIYGRMYQVPFAERIKHETGLKVMAVGAIQGWDHVNTILAAGRADLCALARPHLVHPHLTVQAAADYGFGGHPWPKQYLPAKPQPPKPAGRRRDPE